VQRACRVDDDTPHPGARAQEGDPLGRPEDERRGGARVGFSRRRGEDRDALALPCRLAACGIEDVVVANPFGNENRS